VKKAKKPRLPAPLLVLAVFPLCLLAACSSNEKSSPVPPQPPQNIELGAERESQRAAYFRDIRPRVVTYDGQNSDSPKREVYFEEEFSTGSFLTTSPEF
jgi:hypothetical protein